MIRYLRDLHIERMINILMIIQCLGTAWMSFFYARGDMYPLSVFLLINGLLFIFRFGNINDLWETSISKMFLAIVLIECISFCNYLFDSTLNPRLRGGLFFHSSLFAFFCYSIVWYVNYIFIYIYTKKTDSYELVKLFTYCYFGVGVLNCFRAHMQFHVENGSLMQINYFYYSLIPLPLLFYFIRSKAKYVCLLIALICVVYGYKRSGIIACGLILFLNFLLDSNNSLKRILQNTFFVILLIGGSLIYMGNNSALERTQERMENLSKDGGSGRERNIPKIVQRVNDSPFQSQLVGHGFMGHAARYRNMIDVEMIGILYYYGIIGWLFYLLLHISFIRKLYILYRNKSFWGLNLVCSYFTCYAILFFYSFAAEPFSYHYFFILLFVYLGFIEAIISKKN